MRQQRPSGAYDREILRLAIPAFGALAAEPLYVLADTAIVGHLGTRPLAGLGVAGAVLSVAFGIFNFLAYGTTATVARRIGAGDPTGAAEHGVAGIWLALGLGLALAVVGLALSGPIVVGDGRLGARRAVRPHLPAHLAARRAVRAGRARRHRLPPRPARTRAPRSSIALAANTLNLVLEVVLVYGFHLGIAGSAWGTVIAQVAAALAYLAIVRRNVRRSNASARPDAAQLREPRARSARYLTVRTGSLLLAFTAATAIASRIGDAQVAAHQIAFQLWLLLALCLDAIAIAGQAIVGRGAGRGRSGPHPGRVAPHAPVGRDGRARRSACSSSCCDPLLAIAFTRDAAVRDELRPVLVAVALMQPLGGAVFVLDGILIGAGDVRYLALAMAGATAVLRSVRVRRAR